MTKRTDDEHLHDEAEDIRKETAADSPELQEHDKVAELEAQLAEANSKILYAAACAFSCSSRLRTFWISAAA